MYNMTGIAKFIELDPTRPTHIYKFSDLTRPVGRPDPRASLSASAVRASDKVQLSVIM